MKKFLTIIALGFLLPSNISAEIRIIERIDPKELKTSIFKGAFPVTRICSNGLEFLVTGIGAGTSVTQVFEERNGKSLPAKC